MRAACLGVLILSIGAVAAAQDSPAPVGNGGPSIASNAAVPTPADAKVCVTRTMIGSNMPRRICRSAAQVRKDRKQTGLPVDPSITLDTLEGRPGQN